MESAASRTNAGYTVIETIRADEHTEVVLGKKETSLGTMYVTWQCLDCNDYFWGHYFVNDENAARRDLCNRALEMLS